MTDEERKKLCETLLAWASTPQLTNRPGSLSLLGDFIRKAVGEIELLASENDQLKVTIELLEHELKYGEDD